MENWVVPWLAKNRGTNKVFAVRIFQTFGISESGLDQAVAGLIKPDEGRVAFRASFPQISMRITVEGEPGAAERKLEDLSERVRSKISNYLFAEGDASMEEVVAKLLIQHGLQLAVAESCTGGLIGHRLTNIPGSSKFLKADLVTYSNESKIALLGVTEETLKNHGAVSEECVREMAAGVRKRIGTDVAIATSGVAGPDGGTPEHPVGTVCIALDSEDVKTSRRYQMRGTRDWIKLLTSQVALDWMRRYALKIPIEESQLFRR
jgi:nicotinamide-nucleotide amidase